MSPRFRHWILYLFLPACAVNGFFLLPNSWEAAASFHAVRGLSNPERRYLQKGNWYRAVLETENKIPLNASIRFVSSAPPWYLVYYLYPRLLRMGSLVPSERDAVRKRYPDEWVLVYSEESPPEMTAYPPLGPAHE